jgi:hypothetical protein
VQEVVSKFNVVDASVDAYDDNGITVKSWSNLHKQLRRVGYKGSFKKI